MASGLQELRKRAGYRTARDFAEAMGIPFTTYARYESSPEKIPLTAAWRLADEFGVSIDIIVGRNEPAPAEERGEVQLRYDALAPEFQSSLDDYLEFLTTKSADTAKRKAEAERRRAEALCARLDSLFLAELDRNEPDVALSATATELRGRFKGLFGSLCGLISGKSADGRGIIASIDLPQKKRPREGPFPPGAR